MKQRCFNSKVILSVIATVLLMCAIFSVTVAADNVANYNRAYGQVVPTDSNLKAQVENYNFYGDAGTLYFMQISKGKENANFAVEIYSDSGYQNQVRSFTRAFADKAGNTPLKVSWEFKDIPSGTYYGRCYTYVEAVVDGETVKTIDSSSFSKFTIKINRVGNEKVALSTLVNTADGPRLTWKTLPTAIKYNVYRKASGDKNWTYLVTLNGQISTYTDKTAKSGTTYSYTVKCSDGMYVSKYDTKGLSLKCLSAPKISVAGTGAAGNAKVSWNAVNGADGYYVYRKGGSLSNDSWVQIAKISNGKTTSYIDTTATSTDWEYTYTVKAYSGYYVSAYNYAGVSFDYIKAPTIKRVSAYVDPADDKSGMKIEWSANNKNITGYYVYRMDGKTWKYLGRTTGTSYIDKTAISGQTNTYTVKAYSDLNAGAYNGKGVSNKYLAAPNLKKLTFNDSYASVVKWEKVQGAAGYVVYRKVNGAASWTVVATIKNGNTTQYIDTCKKASGNTYTYTVRAFDSKNIYSWFKAGTSGVCLAKPYYSVGQVTTEDGSLAVEVKWSPINGATKYLVYKRTIGGVWACQTMNGGKAIYIPGTSYIDTKVENGVTYEYAVRAFNDKGDYSSFYIKKAFAVYTPEISDVIITTVSEEKGAQITWEALDDATGYNIYRLALGDTKWMKIGTAVENIYFDSTDNAGEKSYYYAVSAVYGSLESSKSLPEANFADVKLNAELVDDEDGKYILLTWECENETSVTLYKGTSEEDLVSMGSSQGIYSVNDTAVFPGNTYTYKVVVTSADKVDGEATVTIRYPHNPLSATVITDAYASSLNGTPMITVTWNSVAFAEEYIILRSEDGENFTEVGTVVADPTSADPTVTFVDDSLEAEKTYYYKIKATAPVEDRPESVSDMSEGVLLLTPIGNVHDLIAVEKLDGDKIIVELTWSPADYAYGYVIKKTTTPDVESSWEIIGLVHAEIEGESFDTIFVDDTIAEDGTYYYMVVATSMEDRGTSENTCDVTVTLFPEEEPETPEEPEEPTEPETPEEPVDPENPEGGENTEPETPVDPENPEGGENTDPETPTDPEDPENPEDDEDTEVETPTQPGGGIGKV